MNRTYAGVVRNRVFSENISFQPADSVKTRFLWSERVNPVNIKIEQFAIVARSAFQGHSLPI
ncbi:hypothetical protein [Microcoleus sp. Pol11C3]|uniref:hypothetical protein n=1 Tax=Microcoleus sp. Pol11C3 TaxID=3055390 RepID=UPI002FD28EBB